MKVLRRVAMAGVGAAVALAMCSCGQRAAKEDVEVTGVWERTKPSPEKNADTIPTSLELHSPGYNGGLKSIRGTANGSLEIAPGSHVQGDELDLYVNRGGVSVQLDLVVEGGKASGLAYVHPGGGADRETVRVAYKLVRAIPNQDVHVAGSWSGEYATLNPDDELPSRPISLQLQQEGDRLEGTYSLVDGDDESAARTISGKLEGVAKGNSVMLTLVGPTEGTLRLDLRLIDEILQGLLIQPGSGGGYPVELKR